MTEESVEVPAGAIAFISIRAQYKFRGLVNVSGFHVDPTYRGRLMFAVFNAGPRQVHMARGEECFLIWYADVSGESTAPPRDQGFNRIPSNVTAFVADGGHSFANMDSRLKGLEKSVTETNTLVKIAATVVVLLLVYALKDCEPISVTLPPTDSAIGHGESQHRHPRQRPWIPKS